MRKKSPFLTLLMGLPFISAYQMHNAVAQQAPETARIGIIGPGLQMQSNPVLVGFREALADLGYVEGKNLVLEERWQPPGKKDWLPDAIADLERANKQVILAFGAVPARVLKAQGTKTPSVFMIVVPTTELVSNPETPEGNMTGFTTFDGVDDARSRHRMCQRVIVEKRITMRGSSTCRLAPSALISPRTSFRSMALTIRARL